MQKLGRRNTCTPTNILHVRGNYDLSLNVEETLCVAGLKTFSNTSDAVLTGFGEDSRAKPAGNCYKNLLTLITREHARRCVNPAATNAKGSFLPVLKYGYPLPFEP